MKLEIELLIDTVISMEYIDSFTVREVSIALCCLTKMEHCELTDIQKRVSEYLEKLVDVDLLESTFENEQTKIYKKTDEIQLYIDNSQVANHYKLLLIKELEALRDNNAFEISESSSAMRVHSKLCGGSHNLKELMKPAYDLLEERHHSLINKLKIVDQLLSIYENEVSLA
ncbi:hypothetical protein [Pseudoalteromonas sp. ZZD1]|uniref:hypothetical protein n=1 Tax=Pseudoalteromonas sp. ZZD1 TaxID=3139395 RepID=UPI003BAA41E9